MFRRNGNDGKDDSQMCGYLDQICLCKESLHDYLLLRLKLKTVNILYLKKIKASLKVYWPKKPPKARIDPSIERAIKPRTKATLS